MTNPAQHTFVTVLLGAGLAFGAVPAHAQRTSTGTAFAVTADGELITNHHVINECTTVTAKQGATKFTGKVVTSDRKDDLALIKLSQKTPNFAAIRQAPPIRPGEQAITYGFPLTGALTTEGNLTIGYVSALKGLKNNPNYIQITTPVQPGNSGGPLLDQSSNVIGVVAAKLNAVKVMEETGDVPQNVNFAVALDNLRRFLTKNKIALTESAMTDELRPADIGEKARLFTFAIECSPERATRVRTDPDDDPSPRARRRRMAEEDPEPRARRTDPDEPQPRARRTDPDEPEPRARRTDPDEPQPRARRTDPDDEPQPRARRTDPDEPQPEPRRRRETTTKEPQGKEAGYRADTPETPDLKPDDPEPETTPRRTPEREPERTTREPGGSTGGYRSPRR